MLEVENMGRFNSATNVQKMVQRLAQDSVTQITQFPQRKGPKSLMRWMKRRRIPRDMSSSPSKQNPYKTLKCLEMVALDHDAKSERKWITQYKVLIAHFENVLMRLTVCILQEIGCLTFGCVNFFVGKTAQFRPSSQLNTASKPALTAHDRSHQFSVDVLLNGTNLIDSFLAIMSPVWDLECMQGVAQHHRLEEVFVEQNTKASMRCGMHGFASTIGGANGDFPFRLFGSKEPNQTKQILVGTINEPK